MRFPLTFLNTLQETLYDNIEIFYPADYDHGNLLEHSGKLKVLGNLLRNIKTRDSGEHVVVVSNYTQVCYHD